MTKKDFFRIIIKLFGLYSGILTLFTVVPGVLSISFFEGGSSLTVFWATIWALVIFAIVICLFLFLIFRTDIIITRLKLDTGFDEDRIEFENFNNKNIIKLSAIIFGGLLIIRHISIFLNHSYHAFRTTIRKDEGLFDTLNHYPIDYIDWGASLINILIGVFLVMNYSRLADWLIKSEKEPDV